MPTTYYYFCRLQREGCRWYTSQHLFEEMVTIRRSYRARVRYLHHLRLRSISSLSPRPISSHPLEDGLPFYTRLSLTQSSPDYSSIWSAFKLPPQPNMSEGLPARRRQHIPPRLAIPVARTRRFFAPEPKNLRLCASVGLKGEYGKTQW
jgi:hypothetical protein